MTVDRFVFVSGSPSAHSRSARLLAAVADLATARGIEVRTYSFRDFDADRLLHGDVEDSAIHSFIDYVRSARALIVSTPVYKATFSGALKVVLDVIPPDALLGRVALGIATARQAAHLEPAGRALDSVFRFFRMEHVIPPLLLTDDLIFAEGSGDFSEHVHASVAQRATQLLTSLE